MALYTFTRQGSWKDWLNVSRSARRLTIASALVAGLVGMTPLAQAQNAPQGAPPQAAPVQKAPAPNVPAPAVKAPAPAVPPQSAPAAAQAGTSVKRDGDVSRRELAKFDHYLTRHPKVARELRTDPELVNDPTFLAKHTGLQKFLTSHPGAREELKENPSAFMKKEARAEKAGKATKHGARI